jgi:hypothetical protein
MKLKAFVSGVTAIFAASMVYGQGTAQPGQQQQQPGQPGVTQPGQQQPGQPGQPGVTRPGQQQPGQPGVTRPGQQQPGQPGATQPGQQQDREGQQQAGRQQQAKDIQELATQYQQWEGAERTEVSLEDVPERARNTIQGIVDDSTADSAEQIARLEMDDEQVFHAKIAADDEKELQIFVQEDGTVVSTVQQTDFTAAPQNIRTAVEQELTGDATEPEEFHRVMVRGQTAYVAKVEAEDETKLILISQQGETTELTTENQNQNQSPNRNQNRNQND